MNFIQEVDETTKSTTGWWVYDGTKPFPRTVLRPLGDGRFRCEECTKLIMVGAAVNCSHTRGLLKYLEGVTGTVTPG